MGTPGGTELRAALAFLNLGELPCIISSQIFIQLIGKQLDMQIKTS